MPSSLILLPYSTRAAIAEVLSWESSSDSSLVRGLLIGNTVHRLVCPERSPESGRKASGLDDEDRLRPVLTAV